MTSTTHSTDGEEPRVDQRMVDAANLHMHMTRNVQPHQVPEAEVAEIAKWLSDLENKTNFAESGSDWEHSAVAKIATLLGLLASRQPGLTEDERRNLRYQLRPIIESVKPASAGGGYSSKSVGEAEDKIIAIIGRLIGQPAGEPTP